MYILKKMISFFQTSPAKTLAQELYLKIVHHTRSAVFYETYKVPDNINGHFDMIVLHMFLVLHRLEKLEWSEKKDLAQYLGDEMFLNFDLNMRQMGIGDSGMGRRMKQMMQGFYGRLFAYQEAMVDEKSLTEILKRNLYSTDESIDGGVVSQMAEYCQTQLSALNRLEDDKILQMEFDFLLPNQHNT